MAKQPKIIKIPEGPRDKVLMYDKGAEAGSKAGAYKKPGQRTPYAKMSSGGSVKMSKYYSGGGKVFTGRD